MGAGPNLVPEGATSLEARGIPPGSRFASGNPGMEDLGMKIGRTRRYDPPDPSRKGTNGVGTNGVTANVISFLTDGLVWYSR